MEKSQLNAMKCNIDGVIMGLRDQILAEVDERPDDYNEALQTMVHMGQGFDKEEINNQFNISYEYIVNNINRIVALSILDKDCK